MPGSAFAPAFEALAAAGVACHALEPQASPTVATIILAPTALAAAVAALAPLGYGTAANYPNRLTLATPSGLELRLEPATTPG